MLIKHAATAGTIESSDVMVMIEPAEAGIEILLESPVLQRYGRQIRQVTAETLRLLKVENAKVSLVDRGRWTAPSGRGWSAPCTALRTQRRAALRGEGR